MMMVIKAKASKKMLLPHTLIFPAIGFESQRPDDN